MEILELETSAPETTSSYMQPTYLLFYMGCFNLQFTETTQKG